MKVKKPIQNELEKNIVKLQELIDHKAIPVGEILKILSGTGRPLIVLLMSLPFCQPIQIPGFSAPFGLFIAFTGLRMALGKRTWLPKWLLAKEISSHKLQKITDETLWLVRKMKSWIHTRLIWLSVNPYMQIFNGLLIFLLGLFLALPLPIPLSNLMAAWSLFFIALGIIEKDGLFILLGYGVTILMLAVFTAMAFSLKFIF
ncbi:MAG: exopolysaccharide biosynthesis protein [Parachlamydiaceae bacterium]|nr:exopolysaccharide biosynthesis protein [Parachlamydiaceae bacterium]